MLVIKLLLMRISKLTLAARIIIGLGALMFTFPLVSEFLFQSGFRGPIGGSLYLMAGLSLPVMFFGFFLWLLDEIDLTDSDPVD